VRHTKKYLRVRRDTPEVTERHSRTEKLRPRIALEISGSRATKRGTI
jgi:hypothetical protein